MRVFTPPLNDAIFLHDNIHPFYSANPTLFLIHT
jgi:hypothetical protein